MKNFVLIILILMTPCILCGQRTLRTPDGRVLFSANNAPLAVSICPNTITVTHLVSRGVAPVDKTVTYPVATSAITGSFKCWITQNLGADHAATSFYDATEASSGWYWQFDRKQGYKVADDGITRTPSTAWIYPNSINGNWLAANDPCTIELGTGWRVPTFYEWHLVNQNLGWGGAPDTQIYNSVLKMHLAGYISYGLGTFRYRGSQGRYWIVDDYYTSGGGWAYTLILGNGATHFALTERTHGYPVRCIRD